MKKALFVIVPLFVAQTAGASPMPPQPSCEVTIRMGDCRQVVLDHPMASGDHVSTRCSAEILEVRRTAAPGYEGTACAETAGQILEGLAEVAPPGTVLSGVLQAAGDEGGVWYDFQIQDNGDQK